MYSSTLILGLVAIASTSVNALVTPGMSIAKRHSFNSAGNCAPQPAGSGPSVTPDTDTAFVQDPELAQIATQAVTPAGWAVVYQDLQAASTDSGYLGVEELTSYDPGYCAKQCCGFWPGCESFNIYFERDPILDPGPNCTNPASTTRIKCSYWSVDLTQGDATNDGQYCADFHVVIAGSNAYKGGCPVNSTSSSTIVSSTSSTSSTSSSSIFTTSSASPSTSSAGPSTSSAAPSTSSSTAPSTSSPAAPSTSSSVVTSTTSVTPTSSAPSSTSSTTTSKPTSTFTTSYFTSSTSSKPVATSSSTWLPWGQPLQPAQPAQPVQPAPAKPAAPSLPGLPLPVLPIPIIPGLPSAPQAPAAPAGPAGPAAPGKPDSPAPAPQPAGPAQPNQPAQPAQPAQPLQGWQSVQPAKPLPKQCIFALCW